MIAPRHCLFLPLVAAMVALALPAAAEADSIKFSGLWIDNVSVENVTDGEIIYITAAGRRVARSLDRVEGLKLERNPHLTEAEAALDEGEHALAAEKFRAAAQTDGDQWVSRYARKRLAQALDADGQAAEAVSEYLALIARGVHPAYLANPPLGSVRRAEEEVRERVAENVRTVADGADRDVRIYLDQLLEAATAPRIDPDDADALANGDAVVLPADMEDDRITRHLRRGEFDAVLEAVEGAISTTGGLSLALFQKALAQRGKAEADEDEKLLKTAGLNFMRVVVYFPRSRYVGPALVEAGYVHARLGRTDLAESLYDRARLRIDEENDPEYHQHLLSLRQQLHESDQR